MTKNQYWQAHVAKNPTFADEDKEIRMSVRMLRRLMEEAWEKGYEHKTKIDKSLRDVFGKAGINLNDFRKN